MEATIDQFCIKHHACPSGHKWALSTGCVTMAEVWRRKDMRFEWRLWIVTLDGVLPDRTLRLFACWCARQVSHLLTDERSKRAIEVAELYAIGKATSDELHAARLEARTAAHVARIAPFGKRLPERNATWAAYRTTDPDPILAAQDTAETAIRAGLSIRAQIDWLIENAAPNFEIV